MSNKHEGKYVRATSTPKKSTKKIPFRRRVTRIRRTIKHNRFYQFALCILVCLIVFSSGRIYQSSIDKDKYTDMMEAQKIELVTTYEGRITEIQQNHESEIYNIRAEYENLTPEELLNQEAEYMARTMYSYRNNDERDLRTAFWCILNRVDHPNFPNSVKEVCQQPSQWMGYSDDNPILSELYDLAMEELKTWHNNYRPVSEEYVYMSWSSSEIKLRDSYEKTDSTRYWQAG